MPSRRKLKKNVNNRCYHVIYECFTFLEHTPSLNQENVQVIISDAVELRNKLINKINHPETGNASAGSTATFYRNLREDLYDKTNRMIDRLNSLPR
jgi:hypothetical protein